MTASVIASTILFAAIAAIVFFVLRDDSSPDSAPSAEPITSTTLTCEHCPEFAVVRVIDGDTLDTSAGRIRIYGADTPERGEPCFNEATDEMRRLAVGTIRGERGHRTVDPYDRQLYYTYTSSGQSIDELLIRNGLAEAWRRDGQHRNLLIDLENAARNGRVGCLWN